MSSPSQEDLVTIAVVLTIAAYGAVFAGIWYFVKWMVGL